MDSGSISQVSPSEDGSAPPDGMQEAPSQEDLQEYRAYLQRGETRLSTLHRVGGSFISGAGLLTLLPVLGSQTFPALCSAVLFVSAPLFPAPGSLQRWFALLPVIVSLALPLLALISLIQDLIAFYFTAYSFDTSTRRTVVYPRFILSGIRVSEKSLSKRGKRELDKAREEPTFNQLIVPIKRASRDRLLEEAKEIGDLKTLDLDDANREWASEQLQDFVHRYTASHVRTLAEESAKMETSLARHHMFLRVLVLRYAKAFLLTILTTIVTVGALAVTNLARPDVQGQLIGQGASLPMGGDILWVMLLGLYGLWSFGAAYVVRRPIRWIYRDMDDTVARRTPVSLRKFEQRTLLFAAATSIMVDVLLAWYALSLNTTGMRWVAGLLFVAGVCITLPFCWFEYKTERPG